jgi:hypothetical protein
VPVVPLHTHSLNYETLQEMSLFYINTLVDKNIKEPEQDKSSTCPIYFIIKGNKGYEKDLQLIQATPKSHQGIDTK